ncbi:MAG TPA: hypothetical protein VEA15_10090 [Caulobacteraceae bacterium]|nr:hypothetical protein [Caulobacteraceae bacterium]
MLSAVETAHQAYQAAAELAPERPREKVVEAWIIPDAPRDEIVIRADVLIAIAGGFAALLAGGMAGAWLQL